MKYAVYITAPAIEELDRAYEWLITQTPLHASRWHSGLLDAIASLESMPRRCPLAPESDPANPVRQLLYGKAPHAYRILFTMRDDTVLVLHVRHGMRRS